MRPVSVAVLDTLPIADNTPPVRALLAAAAISLVLLTTIAPHVHGGVLGRHSCVACATASGEEAGCAEPDMAPPHLVGEAAIPSAPEPPVTGAPLGAVPGQSPPAA